MKGTRLPESWARELEAQPELGAEIARGLEAARLAHPGLELADDVFLAHLARGGDEPARQVVEDTRFDDLYLACAAAAGDPAALERIEHHLRELSRAACRRDGVISAEDLLQSLRAHIFVATDGASAKIGQYQGRGSLRSWLRMVVGRHLQNLHRGQPRDVVADDEQLADSLVDTGDDPELAYMRRLYLETYRSAFAAAAGRLEHRQRTLLRLSAVDHLSIDEISSIYKVHRATAARWLVRARDVLTAELRRELCKRIGVGERDLESILGLIESRIHLTLERVLATQGDDSEDR